MKKIINLITCFIILFILSGCTNNQNGNTNIEANKTSLTTNSVDNNLIDDNTSNMTENIVEQQMAESPPAPVETELSVFSTPLKSKASGRLNNIRITCSKIDGTIINAGDQFSFCNIVGKATTAEGYQKADVIVNKKVVQALGGGNCQVSTTIYNAVLAVSGLTVTERHEHGKDVTYVPEGKDAAVSYGSLDLKFRNDTGYNIKIYASSDDVNVTIRIVKVE